MNYGGRVTDDKDVRLISAILAKYFTEEVLSDVPSIPQISNFTSNFRAPRLIGSLSSFLHTLNDPTEDLTCPPELLQKRYHGRLCPRHEIRWREIPKFVEKNAAAAPRAAGFSPNG